MISHECVYCRPQKKLRQGNVFTPVCHSVHRGCLSQCMLGYTPPWGGTPPDSWVGTPPWGGTPPRQVHPRVLPHPVTTVTAADGTQPTEMFSCLIFLCFGKFDKDIFVFFSFELIGTSTVHLIPREVTVQASVYLLRESLHPQPSG